MRAIKAFRRKLTLYWAGYWPDFGRSRRFREQIPAVAIIAGIIHRLAGTLISAFAHVISHGPFSEAAEADPTDAIIIRHIGNQAVACMIREDQPPVGDNLDLRPLGLLKKKRVTAANKVPADEDWRATDSPPRRNGRPLAETSIPRPRCCHSKPRFFLPRPRSPSR